MIETQNYNFDARKVFMRDLDRKYLVAPIYGYIRSDNRESGKNIHEEEWSGNTQHNDVKSHANISPNLKISTIAIWTWGK